MKLKSEKPEKLGIPSGAIFNFLEHLEERKLCLHGMVILRHGKIAFECHYPPFNADSLHRMYSVTKSFVAMAVGFMIDEGRITHNSKIIDFFPEYREKVKHPYLSEMTVRDLLLMATPHSATTYSVSDKNWAETFFTKTPSHKSGANFNYDTSGTVTLTALVEKLAGERLFEYLRPRLLDPLGFSSDAWCIERPEGGDWGGSGLLASIHDLARFGLFLLNRGNWQGKQLLSASFLAEACSPLIDNRVSVSSTELQFGYGYQIWQTRYGGFAAWGMGSQVALCLPEKDMVLAITGDTQSIGQGQDIILDAFWRYIYQNITDSPLKENSDDIDRLNQKIKALEFPTVEGKIFSPRQDFIPGKNYDFTDNPMKISRASFEFTPDKGCIRYSKPSGDHEIHFGLGKYINGIFSETGYFGRKIGTPAGRGYRFKASGAWFNERSLTIYLYIIDDYLGTLKINCFFGEDNLTLHMNKSAEWFLDDYSGMASGKISCG